MFLSNKIEKRYHIQCLLDMSREAGALCLSERDRSNEKLVLVTCNLWKAILSLCDIFRVDLWNSIQRKIVVNSRKYPTDTVQVSVLIVYVWFLLSENFLNIFWIAFISLPWQNILSTARPRGSQKRTTMISTKQWKGTRQILPIFLIVCLCWRRSLASLWRRENGKLSIHLKTSLFLSTSKLQSY